MGRAAFVGINQWLFVRGRRLSGLASVRGRRSRSAVPSVSLQEAVREAQPAEPTALEVGPLGRLGRWAADHVRAVALTWLVAALVLGAFAPQVGPCALGRRLGGVGIGIGAGAPARAGELGGLSSQAFMVVVHSDMQSTGDPAFRQVLASVTTRLRASDTVASVVPPRPGATVSRDGHTAIVTAGSSGTPTEAVAAADGLKHDLARLGSDGVSVSLTGASGMWSDFNEANKRRCQVGADLPPGDARDSRRGFRLARRRRAAAAADDPRPGGKRGPAVGADARVRHLDLGDELRAHVRARARDRLRALRRPPLPRRLLPDRDFPRARRSP